MMKTLAERDIKYFTKYENPKTLKRPKKKPKKAKWGILILPPMDNLWNEVKQPAIRFGVAATLV